jgi:hypothetical protein
MRVSQKKLIAFQRASGKGGTRNLVGADAEVLPWARVRRWEGK